MAKQNVRFSLHCCCGHDAHTHTRRGAHGDAFLQDARARAGVAGLREPRPAAEPRALRLPLRWLRGGRAPTNAGKRHGAPFGGLAGAPGGLRSRCLVASRTRCGHRRCRSPPPARTRGRMLGRRLPRTPVWLRLAAHSPGPSSPRPYAACRATSRLSVRCTGSGAWSPNACSRRWREPRF